MNRSPNRLPEHKLSFFEQALQTHHQCHALRAASRLSQSQIVYLAPTLCYWPDLLLHTQSCYFVIRKWFILQLVDHSGVIHNFQVVELPKYIYLGLQLRRIP